MEGETECCWCIQRSGDHECITSPQRCIRGSQLRRPAAYILEFPVENRHSRLPQIIHDHATVAKRHNSTGVTKLSGSVAVPPKQTEEAPRAVKDLWSAATLICDEHSSVRVLDDVARQPSQCSVTRLIPDLQRRLQLCARLTSRLGELDGAGGWTHLCVYRMRRECGDDNRHPPRKRRNAKVTRSATRCRNRVWSHCKVSVEWRGQRVARNGRLTPEFVSEIRARGKTLYFVLAASAARVAAISLSKSTCAATNPVHGEMNWSAERSRFNST